ncbi:hypothetical protein [Clostridium sp. MD294]|uniref:hypothetical protein n=1 Tax=Clostridium sp. MD294 TaxID=97138 RepID=UPI0002CBA47F|nr:hypothetical protein [Clostridium sp. MD294]NDO45729.1 hypothetical protein [Clostridium sp. MD294]USF30617.1 hypothetical protein C820_002060 [Clostridium sp. MD294]
MKKVIDVLILLMLCIFLFSSCKQKQIEVINFEEIANATKIEYTHYMKDTSSTKIIENTDTINQIANWLNDLSLEEIFLSENEIPIDANEKEFYSFIVYQSEEKNINFDYIINSTEDCYIKYNDKWYSIKNPIPFTFIDNITQ